jgi:uncharacterized iron-regulated protein
MTRLFASSLALLLLGCATTAERAEPPSAATAERPVPVPVHPSAIELGPLAFESDGDGFAFVDGRTGEPMSFAKLDALATNADVVLVGEQHDQASHHRLQQRVLEALLPAGGVGLGLEMVAWPHQSALERFGRGDIDVDGLFAALNWEKTWGHDAELYRDILVAAQQGGAGFIGLNAPRELVRAIARRGVDGLTDEERRQLPELDLNDKVHRESIESVFRAHHPPSGSGDSFDRFYAAQVLWDETMADRSVDGLATGRFERVLVLAGVGHVAGYRGIPQRILRRRPDAKVLTIVPITVPAGESPEDAARAAVARRDGDILAIRRAREVVNL